MSSCTMYALKRIVASAVVLASPGSSAAVDPAQFAQLLAQLWGAGLINPAPAAPAQDMCKLLCTTFPGTCGSQGSYCKGVDGHACHDLYWADQRSLCSRMADPATCIDKPLVSCAYAAHFIQAKQARPARVDEAAGLVPVGPARADSPTFEFGRRGFQNMGNTCYLGATLQLLSHSRQLRDLIRAQELGADLANPGAQALRLVREIFDQQWDTARLESDSSLPIVPVDMLHLLAAERGFGFQVGVMEDAHDALRTILGLLQDGLRTQHNSPLDELMSISVEQRRVCSACNHARLTTDNVSDLLLPVPNVVDRPITMEECFRAYFAEEVIEGVDCEHCGGRHPTAQQVRIARAPEVLLVTLKRFEFVMHPQPHAVRMNGEIEVLPELDLDAMPGGGHGRYRLAGIVHHWGESADGGHYVADVLHPDDGFMYSANDGTVRPRMDGYPALRSRTAYILMYERI